MANLQLLLGLAGGLGSGKTTCAEHLRDHWNFRVYRFADTIKRDVATMTGTTFEQNMREKGTVVPVPRHLREAGEGEGAAATLAQLQVRYGRFKRARHGDDFFAQILWMRIVADGAPYVVIDDVRLPCEADLVRAKGGRLIRLERPAEDRAAFLHGRDPNDVTEVGLNDYAHFDSVIDNAESVARLLAELDGGMVEWV